MTLQVGVKVLLTNPDGKILLLHRNGTKYGNTSGSWDIPGGRIEPGATLIENLAREVKEETGLALTSDPRLVGAQDIIKGDMHVVRLTYVAEAVGEPVLDGEEHTEYKWVGLDDMAAHPDLDSYLLALLAQGVVVI